MNKNKRELKIILNILLDDEMIWSDTAFGSEDNIKGFFESAEESLGKMSRGLERVLERDYKIEADDMNDPERLNAGQEDESGVETKFD